MKFHTTAFINAAAVTMAVAYIICSVFVVLWPDIALMILGSLVHLVNLEKAVEVKLTLTGFLSGLVQIEFYTYLTGWLFATLYNRFQK